MLKDYGISGDGVSKYSLDEILQNSIMGVLVLDMSHKTGKLYAASDSKAELMLNDSLISSDLTQGAYVRRWEIPPKSGLIIQSYKKMNGKIEVSEPCVVETGKLIPTTEFGDLSYDDLANSLDD